MTKEDNNERSPIENWISVEKLNSIKKIIPKIIIKNFWIIGVMGLVGSILMIDYFGKAIGDNVWIILIMDVFFCGILFTLIKIIYNKEIILHLMPFKRIFKLLLIEGILLFFVITSAMIGCQEHLLSRYNMYIFPFMIIGTLYLAIKDNKGNYDM